MSEKNSIYQSIIIGGGAAGFFAAIHAAEKGKTLILEQSQHLLTKVKISGGGRCNLTHACFDPKELVKNYPRGSKELLGPFHRFQPKDTIEWFAAHGVKTKTEEDGRMFPVTDKSETIIGSLLQAANQQGVTIQKGAKVISLKKEDSHFQITLKSGETFLAKQVMLATGSNPEGFRLAKSLGHTVVAPVPSLFTFNTPSSPLLSLAGISVEEATVKLPQFKLQYSGPLLITHWGFSGPAVLKLSAFGAQQLHVANYHTKMTIDWLPQISETGLRQLLEERSRTKLVINDPLLPKNLWLAFCHQAEIEDRTWAALSKKQKEHLIQLLKNNTHAIEGKTTFKKEFVTCGGVETSEVNFKTMESKVTPGLYFGGEILNIDGITGGFNFQAAWTTGFLAGSAMQEID